MAPQSYFFNTYILYTILHGQRRSGIASIYVAPSYSLQNQFIFYV